MPLNAECHPTTLIAQNGDKQTPFDVVLFYWPVDDAFDIPSMGMTTNGINRSNPSCLCLRILHEVTDCVVLSVSAQEVGFVSIVFCVEVGSFRGLNLNGKLIDSGDSDSGADDVAITVEQKETAKDDIKLGNHVGCELLSRFDKFLSNSRHKSNALSNGLPKLVGCFVISGASINLIANKYDNKEKIEKQIKYLRCSKLKEMADYLQKMRTTHQIRVPVTKYDRDAKKIGTWLTWEQWVVIAGALNPALKKEFDDKIGKLLGQYQTKKLDMDEQVSKIREEHIEIAKKHFHRYYLEHTGKDHMMKFQHRKSCHKDWLLVLQQAMELNQENQQEKTRVLTVVEKGKNHGGVSRDKHDMDLKLSLPGGSLRSQIDRAYSIYIEQHAKHREEAQQQYVQNQKQKLLAQYGQKSPNQHAQVMISNKQLAQHFDYISDGADEMVFFKKWIQIYQNFEEKYVEIQTTSPVDRFAIGKNYIKNIEKEKEEETINNQIKYYIKFRKWLQTKQSKGKRLKLRICEVDIPDNDSNNINVTSDKYNLKFEQDVILRDCVSLKFAQLQVELQTNSKKNGDNTQAQFTRIRLQHMNFDLKQDDKLLYHQVLKTQSILLVVCSKQEQSWIGVGNKDEYVTRVVVGRDSVLNTNHAAVLSWNRKIDLVSYAETHQILAVYDKFKQTIAFYSASTEKRDISRFMLDKNEIKFSKYIWSKNDLNFNIKHMTLDDATKRLIIIDNKNILRIYDLNKKNWYTNNNIVNLQLKYDYKKSLVTYDGVFLLSFRSDDQEFEKHDTKTENDGIHNTKRVMMDVVVLDEFKVTKSIKLPHSFTIDNVSNFCVKFVSNDRNKDSDAFGCRDAALVTTRVSTSRPNYTKVFMQLLDISVSSKKIRFRFSNHRNNQRKYEGSKTKCQITKLDYFTFMMDKFGSRPTFYTNHDQLLMFNTCFLLDTDTLQKEKRKSNNEELQQCQEITKRARDIVANISKKNFSSLQWETNATEVQWSNKGQLSLDIKPKFASFDLFIKNLIIQFPMQIARTSNGQFRIMHNGENNQSAYRIGCNDAYQWRNKISFGAYDAVISDWKGPIRVVSSMGKQSTGKSYALNHLFGSKFDTSGARCTDGAWMTVRICKGVDFDKSKSKDKNEELENKEQKEKEEDIMYIILDFEGLGTFERTYQEDTMLAVFNASISNCTIFRCENSLGPELEEMFSRFQNGVNQFKGDETLFQGFLLMVIKDVQRTDNNSTKAEFMNKITRFTKRTEKGNSNQKEASSFLVHMVCIIECYF